MALQFDLSGLGDEQVARLLATLAGSDVEECEIEQGDRKISIRRTSHGMGTLTGERASSPTPTIASPSGPTVITSPAVGFFSRSERVSGPPRVEVGSRVKTGDVVGYIRVMNVPHSLLCEADGIVESLLVEDGQAVEYGQPLISFQQPAVS